MRRVKWCAYCRRLNAGVKTIERPADYVKKFDKYIHVCPSCIIEQGLKDVPEYPPTELQEFVDLMGDNAIAPTIVSDEGVEYLAFVDKNGILLDTNRMKFIVEELLKTIHLRGLDESIRKVNQDTYMGWDYNQDTESNGKYLVPLENLNIKRKKFNSSKKWSCTCGNCSKKMFSVDGGEYFTISPMLSFKGTERACSESCLKVIAKDLVVDWINDKNYQRYFNLDKLDKRIIEYIEQA